MKKVIFVIVGAIVGGLACNLLFYLIGQAAIHFDVRLFNSEEEASRNFLIFLVSLLGFVVLGGVLGLFLARKGTNEKM